MNPKSLTQKETLFWGAVGVLGMLAVMQVLLMTSVVSESSMPTAVDMLIALGNLLVSQTMFAALANTLLSVLIAFAIAAVIAVPLGNINDVYAQEFLRKNGVFEVKVVEIPFPEQAVVLEDGTIKAALLPEPFASAAISMGAKIMGWPYRSPKDKTTLVASFVASEKLLANKPEPIKNFTAAMTEASEAANDPKNQDAVIESILKNTKLTGDVADNMVFVHFTAEVKPEKVQEISGLLHNFGILEKPVDTKNLVDMQQ